MYINPVKVSLVVLQFYLKPSQRTVTLDAANFPFAAHTNKKLVQFVLRLCIRWLPEYVEDKYLFTTYLSNFMNLRKMLVIIE